MELGNISTSKHPQKKQHLTSERAAPEKVSGSLKDHGIIVELALPPQGLWRTTWIATSFKTSDLVNTQIQMSQNLQRKNMKGDEDLTIIVFSMR